MAVIIFKLQNVPDDEAQDVRELLFDNNIEYYETSAGAFGISMPALWLKDNSEKERAKQLIDAYQKQRQANAQGEYATHKEDGTNRTMIDMYKEHPARFFAYILSIGILFLVSALLFF